MAAHNQHPSATSVTEAHYHASHLYGQIVYGDG